MIIVLSGKGTASVSMNSTLTPASASAPESPIAVERSFDEASIDKRAQVPPKLALAERTVIVFDGSRDFRGVTWDALTDVIVDHIAQHARAQRFRFGLVSLDGLDGLGCRYWPRLAPRVGGLSTEFACRPTIEPVEALCSLRGGPP
jgi:hypothetical protein